MTVRHLRIDNRLIHGQVTVAWAAEGFALQQRVMPHDKKPDFLQVLSNKKL